MRTSVYNFRMDDDNFLMKEKFRENLSPECRRLLFVIDGWILLMMMENSFFCIETKKNGK